MPKLLLHSSHPKFIHFIREDCPKMAHKPRLQGPGILVLCFLLGPTLTAAQQPALSLLPVPAQVQAESGSLRVDSSFSVALTGYAEPRLDRAADRFLRQLAQQTAFPLSLKPTKNAKATLIIQTSTPAKRFRKWARMSLTFWS